MRYFLVKKDRKYEEDGVEKKEVWLDAWVWPEPLSFDKTPDEKKTNNKFEFSAEGREKALDWIEEQYESRLDEWNNTPGLTEIYK